MMTRTPLMHPLKILTAVGAAFLLWGLLLAYAASPAHAAGSCSTTAGVTTCTFGPTGAEDTFTVPTGVSSIHVVATGAPGAVSATSFSAGRGAEVSGDLTVTPGDTLYVEVGGAPTGGGNCFSGVACVGGFNGGGSSRSGGGGGGASDVREVPRDQSGSLSSRSIVAAGGGGSGQGTFCRPNSAVFRGGAGGDAGSNGGNGEKCVTVAGGTGGGAGGQTAGGAGGSPDGQSGSLGQGGNGGGNTGGGGGGGLYGGGGGGFIIFGSFGSEPIQAPAGGGGGSNLVPTGGNATIANSGPSITISYTLPNTAPVAADDAYSTNEDTTLTVNAPGVLSNDTDANDDALSAALVSGPAHGSVSQNADGSFTYAPNANYNGGDSFTYKASDGRGGEDTATVTITVNAVNDAPTISNITDQTILEDTNTGDLAFTVNDVDNAAGDLALSGSSSDTTLAPNANITFGGSGEDRTVKVSPAANRFGGPATITVAVSDGDKSASSAFDLNVTPVNDAPSFTKGADQSVAEDAGAQSVTGWATGISAGPFETQTVTFGATNDNKSLFSAQPRISSEGTLTYTPEANANGSATVSVKATDDGGTANGGQNESGTQTFKITVTPVNDAPTVAVAAGGQCGTSGTSGQINLMLADVESAPSALTLSATSDNQNLVPNSGLSVGGSGASRTLTVSAAAKRSGTATITVRVSDGQSSGTVPITVKVGTESRDTLGGTSGADIIFGKNGDDTITGQDGNDLLCGGNGAGSMSGGAGDDTLDGANGNDALRGDAGKDILRGGAGDDTITGGTEADSLDGGSGTDTATDYNQAEGDSRTNIP